MSPPPAAVLTGVSGAGKSTVGRALADALGATLIDADDHHPAEHVARMAAGEALIVDAGAPVDQVVAAVLDRLGA